MTSAQTDGASRIKMESSGVDPPDSKHNTDEASHYQKVRLSPEEQRTLRECNRESFYYRCVPLGVITMTATHYGVRAGYLKANPKWGSTFKVLGAGLLSYIIGKYSYQKQCAEKLMQLPNSAIGDALRRRYGRTLQENFDFDQSSNSTHRGTDAPLKPKAKDLSPNRSSDIDSDKNVQSQGLDDSMRPTIDSPTEPLADEPLPTAQTSTTYDELRQKNREEYQGKRQEFYNRRPEPPPPPSINQAPRTRAPPEDAPSEGGRKAKNKYGDVWEE